MVVNSDTKRKFIQCYKLHNDKVSCAESGFEDEGESLQLTYLEAKGLIDRFIDEDM